MSQNDRAKEIQLKKEISQTMRKRNGAKHRITKMIPEILGLVDERGSRTEIRFLRTTLDETLKGAINHHEALMLILPEGDSRFGDEWIDELALNVNSCFGRIERYLDSRKDDPPSSLLSSKKREDIQRWREKSRAQEGSGSGSNPSMSDMCGTFSKLYVNESQLLGELRSLPDPASQNEGIESPQSPIISSASEIQSVQTVINHTNT
eukprot:TCONS_00036413-protein